VPPIRIELGDASLVLQNQFPHKSIDTIITSPPYFNTRKYSRFKEEIGQEKDVSDYINNLERVFKVCRYILKPTGVCIVNIADTYRNGTLNHIPFLFSKMMTGKLKYYLINDIIWKKKNGNPSSVKTRLRNEYEHIFIFVKDIENYYFNPLYEPVSDLDRGLTAVKDYKSCTRISTSSRQRYYLRQQEMLKNGKVPLKVKGDVWEFATSKFKNTKHVAMFPIEIPYYCLKMACPLRICTGCNTLWKQTEKFEVVRREEAKFGGVKHKEGVGGVYSGKAWNQKFFTELSLERNCDCYAASSHIDKSIYYPGTVIDPFVGSGTTTTVADIMGYNSIGIDLVDMTETKTNYEKIKKKVESLSTITIKMTSKNKKVFNY
jgi:site-specific DNA-methyltransferase (adenine-specific)